MGITEKTAELFNSGAIDRWHTPGHKGYLWADDVTELDGGELFPGDAVKKAEARAADVYGVKHLRFLTGGSSMGMKAALLSFDGAVLAGSHSHPCVSEGMALKKQPLYTVENKLQNGLYQPLGIDEIKKGLIDHPDVKAVVIETPTYYGMCAARETAEYVKSRGKLLIADSAHGAHFVFNKELFPESFAGLADFCNLSAHKTLCALTMGAYLTVNNDKYIAAADEALKNLGTTSPLYPLLASLDRAIDIGFMQSEIYFKLKAFVDDFKKTVPCLDSDDFTRLVVDAGALGTDGRTLYFRLLENGIAAERYDGGFVVFIATPFDDADKFVRLKRAIITANKEK